MTDKPALRRAARAARVEAAARIGPAAALAVRDAVLGCGALPAVPGVVAGYWPTGGELDCRPLLAALAAAGWAPCLPVWAEPSAPLLFRPWRPGDALVAGRHAISEPPAAAGAVVPDLLLVPLVGFDRAGNRLGQGAGCYDRTLAALRAGRPTLAIGLAFAVQEFPALPAEPHDQRLDWIVTERGAVRLFSS